MSNSIEFFCRSLVPRSLLIALLCVVMVTLLAAIHAAAQDGGVGGGDTGGNPYIASSTRDMSGDSNADTITANPEGCGSGSALGEIRIISSDTGNLIVKIKGEQSNDLFGTSVGLVGPDSTNIRHLLIGAPMASGTGRAYFFSGPFDRQNESGGTIISALQAHFSLTSYFSINGNTTVIDTHFGSRVAPLYDITGDGAQELRIRSLWTNGSQQHQLMHVFDGNTGSLLFIALDNNNFDGWADLRGDLNSDAVVDDRDLNIVLANLGRSDPELTALDGDADGNGTVGAIDLAIVLDAQGTRSMEFFLDAENWMVVVGPEGQTPEMYFPQAASGGGYRVGGGDHRGGCNPCCMPAPCPCPCPGGGGWGGLPLPPIGCDPPCNPRCPNYDPCDPRCPSRPADCFEGDPCSINPCGSGCAWRHCNPACGGNPCALGCEGSGFVCCAMHPCDPDCGLAPCLRACGGDPCSPLCPEPPCDHLEECDEETDPKQVCLGAERYVCTIPCPLICLGRCKEAGGGNERGGSGTGGGWSGEWMWSVWPPDAVEFIGSSTGDCVRVEFLHFGPVSVTGTNGCCSYGREFIVSGVDLDIDSDNDNLFAEPVGDEESTENESPGKLIFTNIGDADHDGMPDYADGLSLWAQVEDAAQSLGVKFVPIVVRVELPTPGGSASGPDTIMFTYDASDPQMWQPSLPEAMPGSSQPNWLLLQRPSGRIRLWMKNGSAQRDRRTVADGGDFIQSGMEYPLGAIFPGGVLPGASALRTLYVEAIRPSNEAGSDSISVSLKRNGEFTCSQVVTVTAVELEVHDLRYWGPTWNPETGEAGTQNGNFNADFNGDSIVGGAITDGASICLLRLAPEVPATAIGLLELKTELRNPIFPEEDPITSPEIVGTLTSAMGLPGSIPLPPLPTPWPPEDYGLLSKALFLQGRAFYVPPESFRDSVGTNVDPGEEYLAYGSETATINFVLYKGETVIAQRMFILRRPPLVLVHGILSDQTTWNTFDPTGPWFEECSEIPTRLYKLDYGLTSSLGYAENYPIVAKGIDDTLAEYHHATDGNHTPSRGFHGVRYAATRADVVAHSMGGQLTRFYAAQIVTQEVSLPRTRGMPPAPPLLTWPEMAIGRSEQDSSGAWPYLRNANFGAGSVRRLITIASPFQGSALAVIPSQYTEPTPINLTALTNWYSAAPPFAMPGPIKVHLFPAGLGGGYRPPTCAPDLSPGSAAQALLGGLFISDRIVNGQQVSVIASAGYPTGHKAVRWFALVGEAGNISGVRPNLDSGSIVGQIENPVVAALALLMIEALDLGGGVGIEDFEDLLGDGDFVVSQNSQRNGLTGLDAGHHLHFRHTHSYPLPLHYETQSLHLARHTAVLLSSFPDDVSLPALTDGQVISFGKDNASFRNLE